MSIYKAIKFTVLFVLIWSVVDVLSVLPFKYFTDKTISPELAIILGTISVVIAYLSVFFLFDIPKAVKKNLFRFKPIRYKLLLPISILLAGLFLFDRLLWDLFNGLLINEKASKNIFKPIDLLSINFALQCLSTIIISPIFEELFFRKLLLNQLLKRYSLSISVLTSSILFSLNHISNPHNVLATFFSGILFAFLFHKTKNILYPIILHIGFNFIVVFFWNQIAEFYVGLNYNIWYYISAFIGLILIYLSFKWLNLVKS